MIGVLVALAVVRPPDVATVRLKIYEGARRQLARPALYDPEYRRIGYPMGDVAPDRGVCTDVIVRAFRHAGVDLQREIHEDARRNRRAYPRIARLDRNIDHRRVPNQVAWLRRHGQVVRDGRWLPGDVVAWKLPGGLDHVGIVSSRRNAQGEPLIIHNIRQTAEEDVLRAWRLVGHYRYPAEGRRRTGRSG